MRGCRGAHERLSQRATQHAARAKPPPAPPADRAPATRFCPRPPARPPRDSYGQSEELYTAIFREAAAVSRLLDDASHVLPHADVELLAVEARAGLHNTNSLRQGVCACVWSPSAAPPCGSACVSAPLPPCYPGRASPQVRRFLTEDGWEQSSGEPSELLAAQIMGDDALTRVVAAAPAARGVDLCAQPPRQRPAPPRTLLPALLCGPPAADASRAPAGACRRSAAARELRESSVARLAAAQRKARGDPLTRLGVWSSGTPAEASLATQPPPPQVPGLQFALLRLLALALLAVFPLMEIGTPLDGAGGPTPLPSAPPPTTRPALAQPLCLGPDAAAPSLTAGSPASALEGQALLFALLAGTVSVVCSMLDDLADPFTGVRAPAQQLQSPRGRACGAVRREEDETARVCE